jgi:uncharacterized Zn-binding protein involved in type VI secretion
MPATSRITDLGSGICSCHKNPKSVTGIIITGSADHTVEGLGVSGIGGIVICSCGHPSIIISTTKMDNTTNGIPKAEVGSVFVSCPVGVLITGALTAS